MTEESRSLATDLSLPADRAFVVQFGGADGGSARRSPGGFARGRVEHLVSGLATRFDTWDELCSFVERVLDPPAVPQPGSDGGSP